MISPRSALVRTAVVACVVIACTFASDAPARGQAVAMSPPSSPVIVTPSSLTPVRAIINGSFDVATPISSSTLFDAVNGSRSPQILGWQSSHPPTATDGGFDHPIEVFPSPSFGISALTGDTFIELNAEVGSAVYQDLCLQTDEPVTWTAHHHARTGSYNETIQVTISRPGDWVGITPSASPDYTSDPLATRRPDGWRTWTGTWIPGPTAAGPYRFAFDVLQGAPTDDIGNLLEDVSVDLPALVEFYDQPATNPTLTTEAGGAILSLVLNGELSADTPIVLTPTAANEIDGGDIGLGTIADGDGNPFPGASATVDATGAIHVTVPAGSYWPNQRSAYLQIPIDLVDTNIDPDELASWDIVGAPGIIEAGDALCDGSPDTNHSMTIGAGLDLSLDFTTIDDPALGSDVVWESTVSNIDALGEQGPVSVDISFSPTYTSLGGSGLGWSCSNSTHSIACFYLNPLGPGDITPVLTVLTTVGGIVGDTANATAVAAGVGADVHLANNTVAFLDTVAAGLPGTGLETRSGISLGSSLVAAGLALLYLAHMLDLRTRVLRAGMTVISMSSDQWRR
ncbi:MAG: hypothetical protein GY925_03150 [Actinomycetia bacterium]|nr:hypothetical protein [Actinomycetes bacterium]